MVSVAKELTVEDVDRGSESMCAASHSDSFCNRFEAVGEQDKETETKHLGYNR